MKKIGLMAVALAGLALTACAPRYYDGYGPRAGYYHDRDYRAYHDDRRDGDRYDRDHYRNDRNRDDRGDNAYPDPTYQDGR